MMQKTFTGIQFKVELVERGYEDNHICVKVSSEDDESWHECTTFSSFWIDDLIRQLKEAKKEMNKHSKKTKWGFEFNKGTLDQSSKERKVRTSKSRV